MHRSADSCVFILIRHGETDWNKDGRLQGQLDIPLNAVGRQQCYQAADALREMSDVVDLPLYDAVYSSPLQRAYESAQIVTRGLTDEHAIQKEPAIQEWNAGDLQGKLITEIAELYPEAYAHWWMRLDEHFVYPEGESIHQRYTRVTDCLDRLAKVHLAQRVIIFTHGGVLGDILRRCLCTKYNETPKVPLRNAAIHVVRITPLSSRWEILRWGNVDVQEILKAKLPASSGPVELGIQVL